MPRAKSGQNSPAVASAAAAEPGRPPRTRSKTGGVLQENGKFVFQSGTPHIERPPKRKAACEDAENLENVTPLKRRRQEKVSVPVPKETKKLSVSAPVSAVKEQAWTETQVDLVRTLIGKRLKGQDLPLRFVGLDEQQSLIRNVLTKTVETKANNSLLICGPRGSGKSHLLKKCIASLDTPPLEIYLNGLVHADEKSALKTILKHLDIPGHDTISSFGSFGRCFTEVFQHLRDRTEKSPPIVVILDEFETFLLQSKQMILYNLFDIVQSRSNGLCVVGVTCRMDAMDIMEKRVKSRFSHRIIRVNEISTLEQYIEMAQNALTLPKTLNNVDIKKIAAFNKSVEEFCKHETVKAEFERIFSLNKSIPQLFKLLGGVVAKLSALEPCLAPENVSTFSASQTVDHQQLQIKSLSALEVSLVIAATKLFDEGYEQFNFEMVFEKYNSFATSHNFAFRQAVVLKSFEKLISFELLSCVESIGKCPKEFRMVRLTTTIDIVTEVVEAFEDGHVPFSISQWAKTR